MAPDGDSFTGPFSLLDSPGRDPITRPDFPEWGERDYFGTTINIGSTTMNYTTTDEAMAFFSTIDEDGMVWDALDIGVTDMATNTDITLFLGFEPNLAVGDYSLSVEGPPISPNVWIDGCNLVGDSGS